MKAITTIEEVEVLVKHLDLMEQIRRESTYGESLEILRGLIGSLKVDKGLAAQQRDLERLEALYPNEAELLAYVNSEACHKLVLAHLNGMGYRSYVFDKDTTRALLRAIRENRISLVAAVESEYGDVTAIRLRVDGPADAAEQQARDLVAKVWPSSTVLRMEVEA